MVKNFRKVCGKNEEVMKDLIPKMLAILILVENPLGYNALLYTFPYLRLTKVWSAMSICHPSFSLLPFPVRGLCDLWTSCGRSTLLCPLMLALAM